MEIKFVQEKRGEIERIQREFRKELSEKAILQGTSTAINGILKRTDKRLKKRVQEQYAVSNKYWERSTVIGPWSRPSTLYGGIKVNTARLPLIAFDARQAGSAVSVAIHKGKPKLIRKSFIATVPATNKSGIAVNSHTGVFSRGHYEKSGFVYGRERTASGKVRITQRVGPSAFTMATRRSVAEDIHQYMGNEISARVHGILTSRVQKIKG